MIYPNNQITVLVEIWMLGIKREREREREREISRPRGTNRQTDKEAFIYPDSRVHR